MKYVALILFCIISGCSVPTFTNLGNGVAVPVNSIDKYASEHGVTHAEARAQLRSDSDNRRIKEHSARFGISEIEAKRQIEHSEKQQNGN